MADYTGTNGAVVNAQGKLLWNSIANWTKAGGGSGYPGDGQDPAGDTFTYGGTLEYVVPAGVHVNNNGYTLTGSITPTAGRTPLDVIDTASIDLGTSSAIGVALTITPSATNAAAVLKFAGKLKLRGHVNLGLQHARAYGPAPEIEFSKAAHGTRVEFRLGTTDSQPNCYLGQDIDGGTLTIRSKAGESDAGTFRPGTVSGRDAFTGGMFRLHDVNAFDLGTDTVALFQFRGEHLGEFWVRGRFIAERCGRLFQNVANASANLILELNGVTSRNSTSLPQTPAIMFGDGSTAPAGPGLRRLRNLCLDRPLQNNMAHVTMDEHIVLDVASASMAEPFITLANCHFALAANIVTRRKNSTAYGDPGGPAAPTELLSVDPDGGGTTGGTATINGNVFTYAWVDDQGRASAPGGQIGALGHVAGNIPRFTIPAPPPGVTHAKFFRERVWQTQLGVGGLIPLNPGAPTNVDLPSHVNSLINGYTPGLGGTWDRLYQLNQAVPNERWLNIGGVVPAGAPQVSTFRRVVLQTCDGTGTGDPFIPNGVPAVDHDIVIDRAVLLPDVVNKNGFGSNNKLVSALSNYHQRFRYFITRPTAIVSGGLESGLQWGESWATHLGMPYRAIEDGVWVGLPTGAGTVRGILMRYGLSGTTWQDIVDPARCRNNLKWNLTDNALNGNGYHAGDGIYILSSHAQLGTNDVIADPQLVNQNYDIAAWAAELWGDQGSPQANLDKAMAELMKRNDRAGYDVRAQVYGSATALFNRLADNLASTNPVAATMASDGGSVGAFGYVPATNTPTGRWRARAGAVARASRTLSAALAVASLAPALAPA